MSEQKSSVPALFHSMETSKGHVPPRRGVAIVLPSAAFASAEQSEEYLQNGAVCGNFGPGVAAVMQDSKEWTDQKWVLLKIQREIQQQRQKKLSNAGQEDFEGNRDEGGVGEHRRERKEESQEHADDQSRACYLRDMVTES